MKKIALILLIHILFSCENESNKRLDKKTEQISTNTEKTKAAIGDPIIAQLSFVDQLRNSNDIKAQRATLSKIKYDYNKYATRDYNTTEETRVDDIVLKIQKQQKTNKEASIFVQAHLSIIKDNKTTDTLTIYKEENYAEALVAITQYFYVDPNLNLWTLEIEEEEDRIEVMSWTEYKIDATGKIKLVKKHITNNRQVNNETKNHDQWAGRYLFEKSNRDDLRTSFEILILNLNNISIVYSSDGESPETYKNLKGEKVDDNKLKITFNKTYGNMGAIYLQQYENEYIISGEPISVINPGNDEFSIRKVR